MFAASAGSLRSSHSSSMRYFALHRNPEVHAGVRNAARSPAGDTFKKKEGNPHAGGGPQGTLPPAQPPSSGGSKENRHSACEGRLAWQPVCTPHPKWE